MLSKCKIIFILKNNNNNNNNTRGSCKSKLLLLVIIIIIIIIKFFFKKIFCWKHDEKVNYIQEVLVIIIKKENLYLNKNCT